MRLSTSSRYRSRQGVILLVVITLLTLFAVVGVTFVIFAQSEASAARVWRDAETLQRPDMDPEALLAYFLSQMIYDTDNRHSALRGHSLARTMFGRAGSTLPYSGTGRFHSAAPDQFYKVDYTQYAGAAINPDDFGSPNPPYTYPDFNNMFLAAVRGSDGAVLIPSYLRTNPQNGQPAITLRPNTAYHTAFPAMEDAGGDVKNLADSPGVQLPGGQFASNDSIWIDLGFPVMKGPDGRKFKPLFAPLAVDLDNRLNVNVHGNIHDNGGYADPNRGRHAGDQGWGAWEVSLEKVLTATDRDEYNAGDGTLYPEARRIFIGNATTKVKGRYNHKLENPAGLWGQDAHRLPTQYRINGAFHVGSGHWDVRATGVHTHLPGFDGIPATSCFPYYDHEGNDSDLNGGPIHSNHPLLYNFFAPAQSYYHPGSADRHFGISNLEALLRYGDRGSPALTSQLFLCCPQSLATGKARRLITTHAFDLDRPGVTPSMWPANGGSFQLTAGSQYPASGAVPFPPLPNSPNAGEFNAVWQATTAGLGRINLNRDIPWGAMPAYPVPTNGRIAAADYPQFQKAVEARQQFAQEIFTMARQVTGAADPATAAAGTPEFDALRWLAQLSVNIVDLIDIDDYSTPFQWKQGEWVFGTEQPRLVVTEAYAEIGNDPADANANMAQNPFKVRFWVELYNPWFNAGSAPGNGGQDGAVGFPDGHNARLYVDANGGDPAFAPYKVVIASKNSNLRTASNVRGEPDANSVKSEVTDYTPANGFTPTADWHIVRPKAGTAQGANLDNLGWYVLGPPDDFPGTDAGRPQATNRVSTMRYDLPNTTDLTMLPKHTLLLRRLACPAMPPQDDPAQANYNPYVTVDYIEEVPTNDAVRVTNAAVRNNPPATVGDVTQRYSVGRNQPYAASKTQQVDQKSATALVDQPQHTLFKTNVQVIDPATGREKINNNDPNNPVRFPFDWLVFIDRPLVSSVEVLQASMYKPHELTQQFMTGATDPATGKPTQKFTHLAPWNDPGARIYRMLEFFSAESPQQWVAAGGRTVGRININTVWDKEIFDAMAIATTTQFYTPAFTDDCFQQMLAQRSPGGVPGPNDRPFRGFAAPFTAAGDLQYPNGIGIEDTFLAPDSRDTNPNQASRKRLFEPKNDFPAVGAPQQFDPRANDHPFVRQWFLRKNVSNFTTRSNVFAVFVTVGFFEVVDDSDATKPPKLGKEIGRAEGRQVRHRMFAVIDRSNLSVAFDPATGQPQVGTPGPRPYFIPSSSPVVLANNQPTSVTVNVPAVSGTYEGLSWSVNANDRLVIDTGQNQEIVTVTAVSAAPPQITATFSKPHSGRFAISNALLGHPGPQALFDPRNPIYQGVVRYFSIIE